MNKKVVIVGGVAGGADEPSLDEAKRLSARPNSSCYVCGTENPRGLRLHFESLQNRGVGAIWTPETTLEGFAGIIHGGLVSTVLDESMAKAVAAIGVGALTAELKVRFRHPVSAGKQYRVRGWVEDRNRRMIRAEASLLDPAGAETAHAWSSFLVLK